MEQNHCSIGGAKPLLYWWSKTTKQLCLLKYSDYKQLTSKMYLNIIHNYTLKYL